MDLHQLSAMGMRIDRYTFARGEGLPMHQHDVDHLTVIAAGRIAVRTEARSVERGPADAPILFRAHRAHEIEALDDGTVVLNIFAGGIP